MEYSSDRLLFNFLCVLANITGLVVIALLAVYLTDYSGGFSWDTIGGCFNFHILLMVISIVFLQADASLIYRICVSKSRIVIKYFHALIHGTAAILMIFGLAAAIRGHNFANLTHFYTLHSWIGIVIFALYLSQLVLGFVAFLLPVTTLECKVDFMPLHKFFGKAIFLFALGAALTGIMQKGSSLGESYKALTEAGMLINFAALLIVVFGMIVFYLVENQAFRRRPKAEMEPLIPGTSKGASSRDFTSKLTYTYEVDA